MEEKVIHNPSLAYYLRQRGHNQTRTAPDRRNPKFCVYFFEKTDALLADMTAYSNSNSRRTKNVNNGELHSL